MVLSVVSRVYSFEVDNYTDDLVSSGQEENTQFAFFVVPYQYS